MSTCTCNRCEPTEHRDEDTPSYTRTNTITPQGWLHLLAAAALAEDAAEAALDSLPTTRRNHDALTVAQTNRRQLAAAYRAAQ